MKRKCLVVGIILLFVGTGFIPAIAQDTEKPLLTSRGNWLYVGGSGPGNYTRIQDAIDNASTGDKIVVYPGFYQEFVYVDKELFFQGIEHPIVDGNQSFRVFTIEADYCSIDGFVIRNAGAYFGANPDSHADILCCKNHVKITNNTFYGFSYAGVDFASSAGITYALVKDNVFDGCWWGIYNSFDYWASHNFEIYNNTFRNMTYSAIALETVTKLLIVGNTFEGDGIWLEYGDCNIFNNKFLGCRYGIWLKWQWYPGLITYNDFSNNSVAIDLDENGELINIQHNNFYNNGNDCSLIRKGDVALYANYWDHPRLFPKFIRVRLLHWVIDWNPAKSPNSLE